MSGVPREVRQAAALITAEAAWTAKAEEAASDADSIGYGHFQLDEWADLPESVQKSRAWEQMPAMNALADAGYLRDGEGGRG